VSNIVRDALAFIYSISYSWMSYNGVYVGLAFFAFWFIFTRIVSEREKGKVIMPWEKESPYTPSTKKKKSKQA